MSERKGTGDDREGLVAALKTGTIVSWWAHRQPDRPAVTSPLGDRTFAELDAEANRLARALRRRGLAPGDAVAAMVANRPEFVVVLAAAQRAGLRLTPINWHLTAAEAAYIVADCEARAFVADARFAGEVSGAADGAPQAAVRLAVGGEIECFEPYEMALAGEDPGPLDEPLPGSVMLYTSGTTGRPKGVHRPGGGAGQVDRSAVPPFGYVPGESRHLCTGPLYHAAPLAFSLLGPLMSGVGVVLMDSWSPSETLRLIESHRITHSHMVPTMFHRLLSLPEAERERADVSSLQLVVHGAAPCPAATKQAIIDWWGPILLEYYAATEGTGTFVTSEEWLRKPGTVGRPHVPGHIRVLDPETGEDAPPGEVGAVYLRAPDRGRFAYYKDGDKTGRSYLGDHFTLGDVGYLDEDGYLFLTDRSADLIISGGVNIYPAEVEEALLAHPSVGDVAVIGVPDREWGETVVAVVEPQPGAGGPDLPGELIAHCRARLAHYKCPRTVDLVDRLPRAENGKLYKRRLRDEYRAAAGDGN